MGWWFFFFPNIHLDLAPQHARELERDLRRHTRLLFDAMFTHTTHVLQLPGEQRPRTDDPSWHPLTPLGADVQVVTEGDPQQVGCGRARAVSRWFLDDDGIVWSICLATTIAVPGDELAADVAAIRRSWRRC